MHTHANVSARSVQVDARCFLSQVALPFVDSVVELAFAHAYGLEHSVGEQIRQSGAFHAHQSDPELVAFLGLEFGDKATVSKRKNSKNYTCLQRCSSAQWGSVLLAVQWFGTGARPAV
jgi:hypothetical protein